MHIMQAIAAIDKNRGIATQAGIPWDLPKDRAYFKCKTIGQTVVMGYKTYLTLSHPLPNRKNIVLTSKEKLREGFKVCHNTSELTEKYGKNVWIIGGQQVYESLLPYTAKLFLTVIYADFGCDRFFPEYTQQFNRTYKSRKYQDAGLEYRYEVWERCT